MRALLGSKGIQDIEKDQIGTADPIKNCTAIYTIQQNLSNHLFTQYMIEKCPFNPWK
jgi:hypothetical protein